MKAQAARRAEPATTAPPARSGVLRRRCACGGMLGPTGECAECRRTRRLGVGGTPLQPKLRIGRADDPLEREADRVAEQVMRMREPRPLRRVEEGKEEYFQSKPLVQRRVSNSEAGLEEAPSIVHEVLRSPGRPLDLATRAFFEPRFGYDFGRVRVHTGRKAAAVTQAVGARAFSVGKDIVFGPGEYAPGIPRGQRLLAHELTHTLQQRSSSSEVPQILRQVAEPTTVRPLARAPNTTKSVEGLAISILRSHQVDPEDRSGNIRRQLADLDPLTREIVLARIRARMSPEAWSRLGEILAEVAEIEEDEAARSEEHTPMPATPAGRPPGETTRERSERHPPPSGTASRAAPPAGVAVLRAPEPKAVEEPPTVGDQRLDSVGRRVQAVVETATKATTGQVDKVQETVQALSEEVVEQGEEEAQEEGASAKAEDGQLPSLRERLDPITEVAAIGAPPGFEAVVSLPSPFPGVEPGLAPGQAAEFGMAPAPMVAPPFEAVPGAPIEEYNPEAARAEVQNIAANLSAASLTAQQAVQSQAASVRAEFVASAEAMRQTVQAQVAVNVASLTDAFQAQRATIEAAIEAARSNVGAQLKSRRSEAEMRGEMSKTALTDLFAQHRANIESTVENNVTAAEELTDHYTGEVQHRTRSQAGEARRRGRTIAATYPNTERGRVQKRAALGVANKTAQEIVERQPENVEAVREITADIPNTFREKGQEALDGFDAGLPDLLARVDAQVESITSALDRQAEQANRQLDTVRAQLLSQLDALEAAVLAQAEAVGPQAEAQINAGLQTGLAHLDTAGPRATSLISQVVDEAIEILVGAEAPDIEASHEFAGQVFGFVDGATQDGVESLGQASTRMTAELQKVEGATSESLQAVERRASAELQTLGEASETALSEFETTVDGGFENTVLTLDAAMIEVEAQVQNSLDQAVGELNTGFGQQLQETEAKIIEAIDKGLAKNDEALVKLDAQMREAAADAAWDYDHPILSTLADIGAIVLGVIAGILAMLALVVVAIVAFKLIIASLIAVGVSALGAELIAAMAGLALLTYGIYQAYQARVQAGEEGGWATLGGALLDLTGITDIRRAFSEPGLTPFERGFAFGRGVGIIGSFFLTRGLGRRITARFNAKFPRLANPNRRAAWRRLRTRFGGTERGRPSALGELPPGETPPQALPAKEPRPISPRGPATPTRRPVVTGRRVGLERRGYRPAPGERMMTRSEYRARDRAERMTRWQAEIAEEAIHRLEAFENERSASPEIRAVRPAPESTIDIEEIVSRSIDKLRGELGRNWLSASAFGTRLHAKVAKEMRGSVLAGWKFIAERPLRGFANISSREANMTVRDYLAERPDLSGLTEYLPSKILSSKVGDIRPDLVIKGPHEIIIWDLTSQSNAKHLAKTMLYAHILSEENTLIRIGETYWKKFGAR